MRYSVFILAVVFASLAFVFSIDRNWRPNTIEDANLNEISGLVASHAYNGVYWGINDSANAAILFALDKNGKARARINVRGGPYRDIEALGYGNCTFAPKCIYIADIGDNSRERRRIRILIIKEPELSAIDAQILQTIYIDYPNGPRNAEAIMIRPTDGEIFIIEKLGGKERHNSPIIYKIPRPNPNFTEARVKAEPIAAISNQAKNTISLGSITDATFLNTGKGFFIRDYSNLYYTNEPIEKGKIINLEAIKAPYMPQSEAIAVSKDDSELVITSEGRHSHIIIMKIAEIINKDARVKDKNKREQNGRP